MSLLQSLCSILLWEIFAGRDGTWWDGRYLSQCWQCVYSDSSDQPLVMLPEAAPADAECRSRYIAYCCDEACDSDGGSHVGASHDRHQRCGTTSVHEIKDQRSNESTDDDQGWNIPIWMRDLQAMLRQTPVDPCAACWEMRGSRRSIHHYSAALHRSEECSGGIYHTLILRFRSKPFYFQLRLNNCSWHRPTK